jgi:mannose-6-phosphate isomerase-like protein (cupin superfamily)
MKAAMLTVSALVLSLAAGAQNVRPGTHAVHPMLAESGAAAQAGATPAQDPAIAFPVHDLHARLAALAQQARAKGSSGATLEDYGSYKIQLSVRTASGGAEVHAHWDDVMIVEEGSATLITGGTVVDGKTNADGETHGARIEGGHSQTIKPGDVLTVRAGTPHQLLLPAGTTYGAVVVKVHEP